MNTLARRYDAIRKYQSSGAAGLLAEAESLLTRTTSNWERLVAHIDDRHRLINIQLTFYSNFDRVFNRLRQLISQYSNQSLKIIEMVRSRTLNAQAVLGSKIAKIEEDKHVLMKSCNNVRRIAESFLKCSQKNCALQDPSNQSSMIALKNLLTILDFEG
ncbi:hypothetical protein ACOME3_008332 [Neoechinorhynchus agilis]